jgi:peptidoglycan/LPS O-acetylase OafA/YrhL
MRLISYRPDIDGLRTLAVIPVILFHMGLVGLPGGFAGVDVFFVISGFLITSIIIKGCQQGTFSLKIFWIKRFRRIMPVLAVVVFATICLGYMILYGPETKDLGKQGIASLLSVANFHFWRGAGSYWGIQAENSALLHTWSLSVEEQFYLFFPLLVVFLFTRWNKLLLPIILILSVGSFVVFAIGVFVSPVATFYLLPTRIWELGAGALLAMYLGHHNSTANINPRWAVLGLLAIVLFYFLSPVSSSVSLWLAFPVLGALLIIASGHVDNGPVHVVLTWAPVVFIGKISYSLYLWHWPAIVLLKQYNFNQNTQYSTFLLLPFILILSVMSYYLIEKPARSIQTPKLFIATGFVVSLSLSVALYNFPKEQDISMFADNVWYGELYNSSTLMCQDWDEETNIVMSGIVIPERNLQDAQRYATGGCIKTYGGPRPDLMLIGDSHALMWAPILDELAKEMSVSISIYAADGTPAFFDIPVHESSQTGFFTVDEKLIYDQKRIEYLEKWKPQLVVIAARWSKIGDIDQAVNFVHKVNSVGSKVLLVDQPPELYFGDKNTAKFISHVGLEPVYGESQYMKQLGSPKYALGQKKLKEIVSQCEACEILRVSDLYLNNDGLVQVLEGNEVLYTDDDHLSYRGALMSKDRFRAVLSRYFNKPKHFSAAR